MYLSATNTTNMDNHVTYTLPLDSKHCYKKSIKRSLWRSGSKLLSSFRRQRSSSSSKSSSSTLSPDTLSLSNSTSTCSSSTSLSWDQHLTDHRHSEQEHAMSRSATPPASPKLPENHPPAHVFANDQGYSIFYLKLPNGNWMVRCRTADRKIIATYEVDGSMV